MSNVFSRVRCRVCSVIVSEIEVATVGTFIEVLCAERKIIWSGDIHFRLPSFLSPAVDFRGLSLRTLRFLSMLSTRKVLVKCELWTVCSYQPQNLTSKKWWQPSRTMTARRAYALMLVQLISIAADGTSILHSVW